MLFNDNSDQNDQPSDELKIDGKSMLDLTRVSSNVSDENEIPSVNQNNEKYDDKTNATCSDSHSSSTDANSGIHQLHHKSSKNGVHDDNNNKKRKRQAIIAVVLLFAVVSGALVGLGARKAADSKSPNGNSGVGNNQVSKEQNSSGNNKNRPPSFAVSKVPTAAPMSAVSSTPTISPPNNRGEDDSSIDEDLTASPTISPTLKPSAKATLSPTPSPPTRSPTQSPTVSPTTASPTLSPTMLIIPDGSLPARELILLYSPAETMEAIQQADNGSINPQSLALQWIEQHPQNALITTNIQILQRYALATLYYSTTIGNKPWNSRNTYGAIRDDYWLYTDTSECDWYGITCKEENVVTRIELSGNNLHGALPNELSLLRDIEVIALSISNQNRWEPGLIDGTIPSSWGDRMTNLVSLELYDNFLTGSIPENFAKLTKLKTLHLGGNSLEGQLPPFLGSLSSLENLSLTKNEFKGTFPTELGKLTKLVHLDIARNEMNGNLPSEIGQLTNLVELDLSENSLQGNVPEELWSLSKLGWLSLHDNSFDGALVDGIGNLVKLEGLELQGNEFDGSIPRSIGNLSNLRVLDMSQNNLIGGVPQQITSLESLTELYLQQNLFIGEVPTDVCNLMENEGLRKFWTDCGVVCSCCDRCF